MRHFYKFSVICIILIVVFSLCTSAQIAYNVGSGPSWDKPGINSNGPLIGNNTNSSDKEDDYLTLIKPTQKPIGGVDNGTLILYGQWVEPPYTVEVQNDVMRINGVQVVPPIAPPWIEQVEPVVTKKIQDISDLTVSIREEYNLLQKKYDLAEAKAKLLQYIGGHNNLVRSSQWTSEENVHIVTTDDMEFSMLFTEPIPVDPNHINKLLLSDKARYEAQLKNGDLLVIGYGATLNVPNTYLPDYLVDIKKAEETGDEKALNKLFQHDELTHEFLFINERRK